MNARRNQISQQQTFTIYEHAINLLCRRKITALKLPTQKFDFFLWLEMKTKMSSGDTRWNRSNMAITVSPNNRKNFGHTPSTTSTHKVRSRVLYCLIYGFGCRFLFLFSYGTFIGLVCLGFVPSPLPSPPLPFTSTHWRILALCILSTN